MNTETGKVYSGADEIREAIERGEPVVPISEDVREIVEHGKRVIAMRNGERKEFEGNRAEWRQFQHDQRKRGRGYTKTTKVKRKR